jgi:hypothetical protein
LNLVQNSTIFISLVGTFVRSPLALGELQYVSQYMVMNTNTETKQLNLVFSLHFSVAIAT